MAENWNDKVQEGLTEIHHQAYALVLLSQSLNAVGQAALADKIETISTAILGARLDIGDAVSQYIFDASEQSSKELGNALNMITQFVVERLKE